MAKKKAAPMPATATKKKAPNRIGSPVRLDLRPEDLERLDRVCRARGLSRAAYSRMAVLERVRADEGDER
jgi:hypothetical protein